MNVRVFYVVVLLFVHLFVGNVSSANLSDEWLLKEYKKKQLYSLVKNIDDRKSVWYLEHKNYNDLLETIEIAKEEFANDPVFNINDVTAIMIKESKFNHNAVNKRDGGKGLGQITNIAKNWKNELSWVTNLNDKRQNIKAIRICLDSFYKQYGSKYEAIKHYNGSTYKSDLYAKDVIRLSGQIKTLM
jgi:hypothetical protein